MTKQKNIYQILILLLLASFLAFSVWSALQAKTKGSRVTDADYYSKGLKYNQTQIEKKAASVLGWQVKSTLSGRQLSVSLHDGTQPVNAANGTLFLYDNQGSAPQLFQLEESSNGRYSLQLPATLDGEFRAQIEFERQGARLNRQLLLNLQAP